MFKTNYHTHTYRCNHAYGSDEDYVLAAIKGGYSELGFSDHAPWPLHDFESNNIRMKIEELPAYVESVNHLKAKYAGQIKIYLGLECEYFPDRIEWLKQIKDKYHLDYLIFGNHFYRFSNNDRYYGYFTYQRENIIDYYLDDTYNGLKTGMYDCLAHPDLFMRSCRALSDKTEKAFVQLCKWSLEFDVPLEYNLNGLKVSSFFPSAAMFKVAGEYQAKVIINNDCHDPLDFLDQQLYKSGYDNLKDYNCKIIRRLECLGEKE